MILNIYTIKDKLADFGPIFTAETDDLAKRSYLEILRPNPFRKDLDLYYLGIYNTENGTIKPIEKVLLMEGEAYGGENEV